MKVETVSLSALALDPANARLHDDTNLEAVCGSLAGSANRSRSSSMDQVGSKLATEPTVRPRLWVGRRSTSLEPSWKASRPPRSPSPTTELPISLNSTHGQLRAEDWIEFVPLMPDDEGGEQISWVASDTLPHELGPVEREWTGLIPTGAAFALHTSRRELF